MSARSYEEAGQGPVDAASFRRTMGAFATGVAVVTTVCRGEPYGMTVNSLTSVSLDPLLVLICPRRGSATGLAIVESRVFAINLLARDQEPLSQRFIGSFGDRFNEIAVTQGAGGVPLLEGAIAQLCCRVSAVHQGGDHDIVLGEVVSCRENPEAEPLVFHRGTFGTFACHTPAAGR